MVMTSAIDDILLLVGEDTLTAMTRASGLARAAARAGTDRQLEMASTCYEVAYCRHMGWEVQEAVARQELAVLQEAVARQELAVLRAREEGS